MKFPDPKIEAYLQEITPERSDLLKEMEVHAQELNFPAVGPLVGRFLYQLVAISGAETIFELGSGFAYSALWMALALPEGGQIICSEFDHEKADLGMKYLERAQLGHKVMYEVGDALESLHRNKGPYDLIFCDLNKEQYPKALELGVPRLKSGGLFVADNVLWSGKILDEDDQSESTRGIRQFNQEIYQRQDLFSTIIPIRDGVSLSIKK